MSLAVIITNATLLPGNVSRINANLNGKVILGAISKNLGSTVAVFNNSAAPSNPNTFSLGAGTYRIDATITMGGVLLPSFPSSFALTLFDETAQEVNTVINSAYTNLTLDTITLTASVKNVAYRFLGYATISSGSRFFSLRFSNTSFAGGSSAIYCYGHTITATLGGAALAQRQVTVKITKTS